MSNPPDRNNTPREFAFQSTDQSVAADFDGAEGAGALDAPKPPYSNQPHAQKYDTGRSTDAPGSSTTSGQKPFMKYQEVGAPQQQQQQQSSVLQYANSGPYPTYGFSPGEPLTWDWGNTVGYPDYSSHYEPQGELLQELEHPNLPANEFSIPLPTPDSGIVYQSTIVQTPLLPPPKPPRRPSVEMGVSAKRKAESEAHPAVARTGSAPAGPEKPAKRPNTSRSSSNASGTSPIVATATAPESHPRPAMTASVSAPAATEPASQASQAGPNSGAEAQKPKEPSKGTGPQGRVIDVSRPRRVAESAAGHNVLPAGKVFPIQIGSALFRLSGASISSDAPSYFSHFFGDQIRSNQGHAGDIRTLYIDREPDTFRDIAAHLQGYHITPRDGEHFVRLFADAQFYSLPRLTKQLFQTDIFIRIGGVPFQIPRDLFSSPGDSPNYFSLGFAQFFSTPSEVFPGLDRDALLRPPSILPPSVPNRSGETFRELVKILQGYNVVIRSEAHRAELLRDARYFHLKGLEQKLIPCEISYNLRRSQSEILIRLEDIRQSGVSFTADSPSASTSGSASSDPSRTGALEGAISPSPTVGGPQYKSGIVSYARPYTDDHANTNALILEISSTESTTLHLPLDAPHISSPSEPLTLSLKATFHGSTMARITSLFSVIASRMGLPATQPLGLMMLQSGGGVAAQTVSPAISGISEHRVRVRIPSDCYVEIDNSPAELAVDLESGRLGIRLLSTERHHKRTKVSEEQARYEMNASTGSGGRAWIWGGAKGANVRMKEGGEQQEELVVKRAHWRLRVEPVGKSGSGNVEAHGEARKMQVVLCGARLEAYSGEKSRNSSRSFLGG